jgi:hypothetical protein
MFGGRKDQPVSSQNFVRTALGEDLITTIGIHFQGRRRAVARLSRDFNAHAIIGSREGCLRPCRLAAEDQAYGAKEENFRYVVYRSVMASQREPRILTLSGPEGLREQSGAHSHRNSASLVP